MFYTLFRNGLNICKTDRLDVDKSERSENSVRNSALGDLQSFGIFGYLCSVSETFGQRFNALLKNGSGNFLNRRWKKQDFAERLGRHPDTISNWTCGKTAPNDFDLKAVIQLLQLSEQEGKEFEVLRDEAAVLLETKRSQRRRELAAVGQPSVGSLSEDDEDMPINRRTFLGAGLAVLGAPASSGKNPQRYRPEEIHRRLSETAQKIRHQASKFNYAEALKLNQMGYRLLEDNLNTSRKRDTHLLTGFSGILVSVAAFDLGLYDEAKHRAQIAFLSAELSGSSWLPVTILATQADIALKEKQFTDAIAIANKSTSWTTSSGHIKLWSVAAQASARMGDVDSSIDMLHRSDNACNQSSMFNEFSGPTGALVYHRGHHLSYGSNTRNLLGDFDGGEEAAIEALRIHMDRPIPERSTRSICLENQSLAEARIGNQNLEGAHEALRSAFLSAGNKSTETIRWRFEELKDSISRMPRSAIIFEMCEELSFHLNT